MSKKQGRRPFGYYDDEAAVIEQIFIKSARRPRGKKPTLKFLADSMNRDGYKTQKGLPWYPIAIGRIVRKGQEYYANIHHPASERKKAVKKTHLESGDFLSDEEIAACREVLRDSDRIYFELLIGSGLRASEACALRIKDIGVWAGKSQIDVRRGKGSKQRSVHVGKTLKMMLAKYIYENGLYGKDVDRNRALFINRRGRQISYSDLYHRIAAIRERSGVESLHPHALRHTFATILYNYKMDLEYVREQLGHASIRNTQIYAKTFSDSKIKQMEGFDQRLYG